MSITWKDVSSYSYTTKPEDRTTKTVECQINNLRVVVTHHISYPPDIWLMFIDGITNGRELESADLEAAKTEAIAYLYNFCKTIIEEIDQNGSSAF